MKPAPLGEWPNFKFAVKPGNSISVECFVVSGAADARDDAVAGGFAGTGVRDEDGDG
jgi:hypothetical protein